MIYKTIMLLLLPICSMAQPMLGRTLDDIKVAHPEGGVGYSDDTQMYYSYKTENCLMVHYFRSGVVDEYVVTHLVRGKSNNIGWILSMADAISDTYTMIGDGIWRNDVIICTFVETKDSYIFVFKYA